MVELEDAPEIPDILTAVGLLHGDLIDRGDFAFEDDLGKGFEVGPSPHPGGDPTHDGFIEGHLDFHSDKSGR